MKTIADEQKREHKESMKRFEVILKEIERSRKASSEEQNDLRKETKEALEEYKKTINTFIRLTKARNERS